MIVANANLEPIPEESAKHLGHLPEKKTRVKRASIEALFFITKDKFTKLNAMLKHIMMCSKHVIWYF